MGTIGGQLATRFTLDFLIHSTEQCRRPHQAAIERLPHQFNAQSVRFKTEQRQSLVLTHITQQQATGKPCQYAEQPDRRPQHAGIAPQAAAFGQHGCAQDDDVLPGLTPPAC